MFVSVLPPVKNVKCIYANYWRSLTFGLQKKIIVEITHIKFRRQKNEEGRLYLYRAFHNLRDYRLLYRAFHNVLRDYIYTGRFIMFPVITDFYTGRFIMFSVITDFYTGRFIMFSVINLYRAFHNVLGDYRLLYRAFHNVLRDYIYTGSFTMFSVITCIQGVS
jgi:hypothetical protein